MGWFRAKVVATITMEFDAIYADTEGEAGEEARQQAVSFLDGSSRPEWHFADVHIRRRVEEVEPREVPAEPEGSSDA
jgi:hypothetical protein